MATPPPVLRPHQREAVEAVLGAFAAGERRATVISACGTGKTYTAAEVARRLVPEGSVLVALPTLALLTQTIRRWRQAGRTGAAFAVCSLSQPRSGMAVSQALFTEDAEDLATRAAGVRGPVTVFATYGSLRTLSDAHALGMPPFDLIVSDEAHRTCLRTHRGWGRIHRDDVIPSKHRLYMTATPRIWRTPQPAGGLAALFEDAPDATMDRVDLFGPVVYRLGLAEAIERGILADYRVVMPVVEDHDLRGILTAVPGHSAHHNGLRTAALHVAMLRAIREHGLRRMLVFHNRIHAAHAFADTLPLTAAEAGEDLRLPSLWSKALDSGQSPILRQHLIDSFASTEQPAVLSNVRVLNEGVDIPSIDAVAFAAPRKSVIDAIQAIGRALRQPPGAGKKATLVIPVYLPDGASAHDILRSSDFAGLWQILQALRAHDNTFLDRVAMPHSSGPSGGPARRVHYHLPERAMEIALALGLKVTLPPTGDWNEALRSATAYQQQYEHLDVPADYQHTDGFALGEWLANQRIRHIAGRLDTEQRQALDDLGMLWTTPADDFPRMLEHARAWAEHHGHLAAPHHATHAGHRIGSWLSELRRKAKDGRLTDAHEEALQGIDPWWNPPFPITWRRTYAAVKAHVEVHGNGHIPNTYKNADGVPLGQWLSRQRNHFTDLTPAQVELMLELHIAPAPDSLYRGKPGTERRREFFTYLHACQAYLAREGHLRVPQRHKEEVWNGHVVGLGAWIHRVRKNPEKLTEEERAALDGYYMVWDLALGRARKASPGADAQG